MNIIRFGLDLARNAFAATFGHSACFRILLSVPGAKSSEGFRLQRLLDDKLRQAIRLVNELLRTGVSKLPPRTKAP